MEKLKLAFEKSDRTIQKIINNALLPEIKNNPEFANKILNEKKNVQDMMNKIFEWVRTHIKDKPHAQVDDPVVYSLAIHYWQEEDPKYIPELFDDSPLIYGDISKQFEQPIIKHITGTIIKETIREVERKTPKKDIQKKVEDDVKQLSLFGD
jgi:hypothetical protein